MASDSFQASDGTVVIFREPKIGDARQDLRLINESMDESMSGLMMNRHTTIEDEKKWIRGRIQGIRRNRLVMLSAVVDGVVKGNCDVDRQGWKKSHRALLGVLIAKDLRGKGIGEELMRRTISLAERRLKGVEFIDLFVFDYNRRAKNLYSKLGFVEIARIPKGVKEGSRYYDELLMTRRVRRRKR